MSGSSSLSSFRISMKLSITTNCTKDYGLLYGFSTHYFSKYYIYIFVLLGWAFLAINLFFFSVSIALFTVPGAILD